MEMVNVGNIIDVGLKWKLAIEGNTHTLNLGEGENEVLILSEKLSNLDDVDSMPTRNNSVLSLLSCRMFEETQDFI